ncbi:MAG: caspase family protein, partial [Roseovarius confluentis]
MQPTNIRRLFLFLALVVSVGASLAPAQTSRDIELVFESDVTNWPDASKRWALLVGVSEYQDQTISPVPGAQNDAEALRDALVEYAGFPREQVLMLTSNQDPS